MITIELDNGKTTNRTVWFPGTLDSGVRFTVCANWNEWDGWSVDDVMWDEGEGTDEEMEAIKERFIEDINA